MLSRRRRSTLELRARLDFDSQATVVSRPLSAHYFAVRERMSMESQGSASTTNGYIRYDSDDIVWKTLSNL